MTPPPNLPAGYELLSAPFLREHGAVEGMKHKRKGFIEVWRKSTYSPGDVMLPGDIEWHAYIAPIGTMARLSPPPQPEKGKGGEVDDFPEVSQAAFAAAALVIQTKERTSEPPCPLPTQDSPCAPAATNQSRNAPAGTCNAAPKVQPLADAASPTAENEMRKLIEENKRLYRLTLNMRGEIRHLRRHLKDSNRGAQTTSHINWSLAKKLARYENQIKALGGTIPTDNE